MGPHTGASSLGQPGLHHDTLGPANTAGCQERVGDELFHASVPQSCYLSPRVGQAAATVTNARRNSRRSLRPNGTHAAETSCRANLLNNVGALVFNVVLPSHKGLAHGVAAQQVGETKLKAPMHNNMALLSQPLTEPGIASICRDTFADMCTQRYETQCSTALFRRQRDQDFRQESRQQAIAWRKSCKERERREHEKLRRQTLKEEQAREKEVVDEEVQKEERDQRWKHVFDRVQDRTEKAKSMIEADQTVDKMSRADHRVAKWRQEQLLKKRAEKREEQIRMRKENFENLPLHKRRLFEDVFKLYDADQSGQLKASELHECLLEIGFRGVDQQERNALVRICEQTSKDNSADADVDIYHFASGVVPAACRALQKLRRASLVDQLSMIDTAEDGSLDLEQLTDVVKDIWPVEANTDAADSMQAKLMEELRSILHIYVYEETDFVQLCQALGKIFEEVQWNNFVIQQKIRERRCLDDATFREFRQEIVHLDRVFERIDVDHSGELDRKECLRLVKEMGLIPRKATEKREVEVLVEAYGNGIDFSMFLKIVEQIRNKLELHTRQVLRSVNPAWALDEANSAVVTVDSSQLGKLMIDATGISLRSRKERRVVSRVIREANADGDDLYTIEEVARICRQAQELIRKVKTQEELDVARENSMTEPELNQARYAFEMLDKDESGSLDMTEVQKAIGMLHKGREKALTENQEKFALAFTQLDDDNSGSLEFPEFLKLMKHFQDREGVFAHDSQHLTTLSTLSRSALIQVLHIYDPNKDGSMLKMDELLEMVSGLLGIEPNASLQAVSNVTKMMDLIAFASRKRKSIDWA